MAKPEMLGAVTEALIVLREAGLANARELTPTLVATWAEALELAGMPVEAVKPTAMRLILEATFFPAVAEFLKAWRPPEDEDAAAELAWQRVLALVRRHGGNASLCVADLDGDGHALWAVDRMRWTRLCAELTDDNRALLRAEFVRTYKAAKRGNVTVSYVAGRSEIENGRKGRDLTPALVGRPDWRELPAREERPTPQLGAVLKSLPAA